MMFLSGLATGQNRVPATSDPVNMTAGKLIHEGTVLRGSGHVQVTAGFLVLRGDEGWYRSEADEIEVRGHARTTLPARPDRSVVRYGEHLVLVTGEAIELTADRLTVKDGLLRAWGSVAVTTDQGKLQSDEFFLYLRIGDAEARGNVRLNGGLPDPPGSRNRFRRWSFPPDIVRQ
jgi:hypothetical protein